MFKSLLTALWRAVPGFVRRAGVRAVAAKYTVTAAAVVLDPDGRVLVLRHAFRDSVEWAIPGGFVGSDEQPEAALRRELREETGLDLEEVRLVFARTVPRGEQIQLVYRARARGEARPCSIEIKEAAWLDLEALAGLLGPSQRQTIARALDVEPF